MGKKLERLRFIAKIDLLKEVAEEYPGMTTDNIIAQMEARYKGLMCGPISEMRNTDADKRKRFLIDLEHQLFSACVLRKEYSGKTIDNIVVQLESRINELNK